MDRIELTIAVAGVLFTFFIAGWIGHLVWARLMVAASPREDRADELAAELLVVEEDRDRRVAEAVASARRVKLAAAEERERLEAALREREAELEAAMDGLRRARAEAEGRA